MLYHADFESFTQDGSPPVITIRDDRGTPKIQLELEPAENSPGQALLDARLQASGWRRTAEWTQTDRGWHAPVSPEGP